jgi:uncharacterized repeat protein (TIGR01451 family)
MDAPSKPVRFVLSALAALALLALLAPAAASASGGTIRALKGGDRKVDESSNRTYALPVAGALFEYTSSKSKAADPASTGWTAFPSVTDASGAAAVNVAAGTYYVRERTVLGGFANYGPVKSLSFDPSSGVPTAARPYVAKVKVENGRVTEAYPNRSAAADPDGWDSTAGGDSGSPFVNVRDNPAFPGTCGINILLVLDRSGSIEPFKSTYRDAAKTFVNALAGTPTQIGIVSFSAGSNGVNSYQDGSGSASLTRSPLDLSASGSVAALDDTIDAVYANPSGGTNWDRGLQKASQARGFTGNASTGQTANPDVVVFITDGNPTARSTDGSDSGSNVDLIDLTAGMASANLVKSQQARALSRLKLYALGVGSGVTADNLKAVSGPVLGEDYETPTVAQFAAKLTELAARTCGARIFVRKRLAGNGADQADWAFSATSNGGSISYLDGNRRTHATAGNALETGVILTQLPAGGREVTVTEDATGQPLGDFQLDSVSCRTGGYDGAPVAASAHPPLGVKLAVQRGSTLYCTFTNAPAKPKLTIAKSPDSGMIDAGADAVFTIVVSNTGDGVARNVTLSDQLPAPGIGGWVVAQQPSQGSCSVNGANLLTCTGLGDLAKGQSHTVKVKTGTSNHVCPAFDNPAATASADNHPPVSDGGKVTCRKDAKITVVKQLAPASDAGRFDLKVGATVVAAGAGDGGQGSTFVDPGTHPVSEAGAGSTDLADYDKSIACRRNGQPAESGAGASLNVAAGYDDVIVCTITNTRLGKVVIEKQTVPGGDATAFGFSSDFGPFQLADDGLRTITRVLPNVGRAAYEVTEGAASGYRLSSIDCGQDADSGGSVATRTASIHVSPGETVRCTFTNAKLDSKLLVVKDGTQRAHHGDTLTYTFDVTNMGNSPLHDVGVTDDRCAPVTRVSGDQLLDPGEHWIYTCSYAAPAHGAGEEDPIRNTVTATAKDEHDRPVTDTDTHETDLLHPDIEIDKQVDKQTAHVGDTLAYTFVVTNEGDTPLTVEFSDPRCDAGTLVVPDDELLDVDETWTYTCSHVVTEQDPNPLPNTATVTGTDELGGKDSDADTETVTIIKPAALVVKEGNQFAYPGDTVTFTFAVTNNGDAPLSDVAVTDDRCAPVTRVSGDDLLDPGEKWIFTCSKQIPADHRIGDENPIRNVATATGKDPLGKPVSSQDDHLVRVLHPAIDIEKTGPATARVGTALAYRLTVTNPGDVPFAAQDVVVSDPRCEAPPAGPHTGADQTPDVLDPGDAWTYTCVAQTSGEPAGTFVNTATVTAKDFNGRTVTDTDEFPTVLEAQAVLPQPEIVGGRAQLRGPSGCVRGPFKATVRGRQIARVTFYRDGKRIKTIVAGPGQRTFTVRLRPGNRSGVHRVTARVVFKAVARTRARTLRLSYQSCRVQVVQPRFTG